MLKKTALAISIAMSANALAISPETRQQYIAEFSMIKFMYPSEQASWYWQNLDQVLPQATVKRTVQQVKPLPRDLVDVNQVYGTLYKDEKLGSLMQGDNPSVNSMMIIKNGKVIFEHFNMPYNTRHVWMSNAKTIVGTLVAMLEAEGKIDVMQPLKHYLPELNDKGWGQVRILDVLNMQSGMDAEENDAARADVNSHITQLFLTEFAEATDYYDTLINIPTKGEAGKAFEYSSANTQMLGLLIARVEGKPLSQVFEERVWSKAQMTSDMAMTLTPDGHEVVHGLVTTNTEDMARYAMLYTDSGNTIANERVISKDIVNTIRTSVTPDVYTVSEASGPFEAFADDLPLGGSYQFDAIWEDGDMFKGGMRGQGIYISPDKDVVAVWFSNRVEKHNVSGFVRNFVRSIKMDGYF
ncbi:serine hydrolase [Vibrio astriarenae]|uniref:Serine hydrolase n=1 Tax=Vibrio astriarenae TaxID=1481923 RepID=A0A7Z2T6A7_9VIBR|nr:serine hydrolase domain-containing protein [Vibrio astriarenae]QIA64973.1 serine hydrolase [Vibrio astriarenae]